MKAKGFVLLLIAAVAVGGAGGYVAGSVKGTGGTPTTNGTSFGLSTTTATQSGSSGQTTSAAAGTGSSQQGQGQGGTGMFAGGGTSGTVQKVEGNVMTLAALDGSSVTVSISSTTSMQKTGQGAIADIVSGETITVSGTTQSDGSISATTVSIGAGQPLASRLGQAPGGVVGTGGIGAGGRQGAVAGGGVVSGTVQSVQGNTVALAQRDGTMAKVTIGDKTTIEKTVQGSINDILSGVSVLVIGTRSSDGSISATNITIMPSPSSR